MINFTLLINGSEVDLNDKVSIALTKTYESLEDPTKIFTDFSKTVTIPMTARNNIIFENAFRADQVVTTGGLDPRKKVPFILLNNQTIIMVGVAKVIDTAANSPKDRNYYVVLYSKMGEIFNELKQLTFHKTDDNRYTIPNPLSATCTINRDIVKNSFCQENHNLDLASKGDLDYIGFMPTYQGRYDDFKSDKQELFPGKIKDIDYLEDKDGDKIDGSAPEVDEHYTAEFRSYYQQPFVYVDAVWQLLKQKIEQITDYTLDLDPSWFNAQNPYYADLVVTMPSLFDNTDNDAGEETTEKFSQHWNTYVSNTRTNSDLSNNHKQILAFTHSSGGRIYNPQTNRFFANGNPVHFKSQFEFTLFAAKTDTSLLAGYSRLRDDNNLFLEIRAVDAQTNAYIPGAVSKFMFYSDESDHKSEAYVSVDLGIVSRDTPMYVTSPDPDIVRTDTGFAWGGVVQAEFDVTWPRPFYIIANQYAANNGDPFELAAVDWSWVPRWDWLYSDYFQTYDTGGVAGIRGLYWYLTSRNTECTVTTTKRSNSQLTMNRIWSLDKSPFDIMLDYCKMFRLVFDLDTDNKAVRVLSRDRYFEDSTIEDWTDKLDRTKEYKLKPINFDKKYFDFKLAEGKGGLYDRYNSLYGRNYGSYKVETGYDFNDEATEVFTEIPPSMVASKQQDSVKLNTRHPKNPNFMGFTYKYLPNEYFPENDNDGKNAGNSGQFYFRNGTYTPDPEVSWIGTDGSSNILISDDTDFQITRSEYCWHFLSNYMTLCNKLPKISTYSRDGKYSIFFNNPKELYFKRSLVPYSNAKHIYQGFWENYLNDRYSVQTKVLNTYLYLTADDWQRFKFNKFILIDNILYMVNKIKDFDLTTDRSTKVELVQVNDRANYETTSVHFPYLYTIPGTATVTTGAVYSVEVKSSSNWRITYRSPWLYAVKNGNTLEVYWYSLNYDLTTNGTVVLKNDDNLQWSLTLHNTQNGMLIPSPNSVHFNYQGGTRNLTVASANTLPVVASAPSWVTATFATTSWSYRDRVPGSDTLTGYRDAENHAMRDSQVQLTITASRNSSRTSRNGFVIITNMNGSCAIRVSQGGNNNIIPIVPGGGREIVGIEDAELERLELAADVASEIGLNSPHQVDFLTLSISKGLTDATNSPIIGETSFYVQPTISEAHTQPENMNVDGGYITVTTVDGENIRWPYNIGSVPSYDVHIYAYDDKGYVTVGGVDGNYLADRQSGDTLAISATANAGYTFAGWSDGNSNSSRTVTVGTEPLTLYASFAVTVVNRSIAYNLTRVNSSNSAATVADGTSYTTTLTPVSGYQISSVRVVMGATDITASSYRNGKITIASVTGNVTITASATAIADEWNYKWKADDGTAPLNFRDFDTNTGDISRCRPDTGGSFTDYNGVKVWAHDADSSNEWYLPGPTNIEYLEMEAVLAVFGPDDNNPLIEMSGYTTSEGIEILFKSNYAMMYNKGGSIVDAKVRMDPSKVGLQKFNMMIDLGDGKEYIKVGKLFGYDGRVEPNLSLSNRNGIFNADSGSKFLLRELRLRWKLHNETTPTYAVSVSAVSDGSVVVDGVSGTYTGTVNGGTTMTVKAEPDQGYIFQKWSDNSTQATRTVTVNSDTTLTAQFTPSTQYVIYYETSDGQTVTPGGTVAYESGQRCTLVDNTYQDGQGMLVYDNKVWGISGDFLGDEATITAVTLPDTLEIIDGIGGGFKNTGITSIDLKNVQTLNGPVFNGCPITKLYIPKALTDIDSDTFNKCKLEYIEVDPWNPVYDSRNNCNCIVHTKTDTIVQGSLNGVIDDTIKRVESGAFVYLPVKAMKFGKRVEYLGEMAFGDCSELAELVFVSPNPPKYEEPDQYVPSPFENVAPEGVLRCPAGSAESYEDFKNKLLPAGWTVEEY